MHNLRKDHAALIVYTSVTFRHRLTIFKNGFAGHNVPPEP